MKTFLFVLIVLCIAVCAVSAAPPCAQSQRSIALGVDKNGANNAGGDSVLLCWEINHPITNCIVGSNYTLAITGPGGFSSVQNYACAPGTINNSFAWAVSPARTAGVYTATLAITTRWTGSTLCSSNDFTDTASVQFAVCPAGKFRIFKFRDNNGNGTRDNGEPVIVGWCFKIRDNSGNILATDSTGKAINPICTNADGYTDYITLATGNYTVEEIIPADQCFKQTTPAANPFPICIVQGTNPDITFGNMPYGRLRISKFGDTNGNGIKDNGEQMLPNWSFEIKNGGGAVVTTDLDGNSINPVTTGASGSTIEMKLPLGTYSVREIMPTDVCWKATTPATNPTSVSLASCATQEVLFGNVQYACFRVFKFQDSDGNGQRAQDGTEPPLAGWNYTIKSNGTTITKDLNGTNIDPITTGADGFTPKIKLPIGNYSVWEDLAAHPGWLPTTPADAVASPYSAALTLYPCGDTTQEWGNWRPIFVTGFKYQDKSPWPWTFPHFVGSDGQENPSCAEPVPVHSTDPGFDPTLNIVQSCPDFGPVGVSGIQITLFNADHTQQLGITSTTMDGSYSFGPVQYQDGFVLEEGNLQSEIVCTPPLDVPICPEHNLTAMAGTSAPVVATSPWLNLMESDGNKSTDFDTPDAMLINLAQYAGEPPNSTYTDNNFYNRCLSRLWGVVCAANSKTPLAFLITKDGEPVPANPVSCTECGFYQLAPTYVSSNGEGILDGTYTITPPTLAEPTNCVWKATIYGANSDCVAQTVTVTSGQALQVYVAPCSDVRVDWCEECGNERKCFMPVTFTQDGWRTFADPNITLPPGGMLYSKLPIAFRGFKLFGVDTNNKLIVGDLSRKTMTYDPTTLGIARLALYFPQTGIPGGLKFSYLNTWQPNESGALSGETLALAMNVAYNDKKLMPRTPGWPIENFIISQGPLRGKTVGQALGIACKVLGGSAPQAYGIMDVAGLTEILQKINANYEFVDMNTFIDRGYLQKVPNQTNPPIFTAYPASVPVP